MLTIEILWLDADMLELGLSISNERFAGQTTFYAALDELAKFAACIEDFPRSLDDIREYEFGGPNLPGYGGAKIRLASKDRSGHLIVQVSVYAIPSGMKEVVQSATVQLNTIPAAIDCFVRDLRCMRSQIGAVAMLKNET